MAKQCLQSSVFLVINPDHRCYIAHCDAGGMLAVPSISVEGLHFRFIEASMKALETHPKNFRLRCAMAGAIYCVQDRFKFSEWVHNQLTLTNCIKMLEATKIEPDISAEQRMSIQQSIICAISVLSRRDSDTKALLADDCKAMHAVVQPLRDCIQHEAGFPERMKYDDLQLNCWLVMARVGESTDFSACEGFNKVPSELGAHMMTRHKLVSDMQLAICTCLYNSEAIRFEPEDKKDSVSDAIAAGVMGKGKLNALAPKASLKKPGGLGMMKKSKWAVIRQVAKKQRDTRLLRTKEQNKEIMDCTMNVLLNHKISPDRCDMVLLCDVIEFRCCACVQ